MTFLGHTVDAEEIDNDPTKITALTERAKPGCVEDVRSFLGLAGYYRDHILRYADIVAPMTELTKKSVAWYWGEAQDGAYKELIKALTGETILVVI